MKNFFIVPPPCTVGSRPDPLETAVTDKNADRFTRNVMC